MNKTDVLKYFWWCLYGLVEFTRSKEVAPNRRRMFCSGTGRFPEELRSHRKPSVRARQCNQCARWEEQSLVQIGLVVGHQETHFYGAVGTARASLALGAICSVFHEKCL